MRDHVRWKQRVRRDVIGSGKRHSATFILAREHSLRTIGLVILKFIIVRWRVTRSEHTLPILK